MTKQSVVVPEVTVAMPPNTAALFPYPPPRAMTGVAVRKKYLQAQMELGSGLINGWVDSMRASSPTHAKAAAALAAGVDDEHTAWMGKHPSALSKFDQIVAASKGKRIVMFLDYDGTLSPIVDDPDAALAAGVDDEHTAWMGKHPSALSKFDQIVAASKGKRIVMFLDYDGTLSPIVDDPDAAFMSDTMRLAVRSVAKQFPTAIVSGRCRDKVFDFVKLAELYYAGSHGMDIRGPAKASQHTKAKAKGVLFQPASEFIPMIEQVNESLIEKTKCIPGSKVENNKFCVSVHFRCVDEKNWSTLADIVKAVLKEYPKLKLTQGRKVLEIRPTIKWDKGKALEFLLESLGFADCSNVLPVYIGDDRTDEDAFKVLRKRGQGIGILVSKHAKETNASYSLQEPAEVMEFLLRLVEWDRLSKSRPRW